MPASCSNAGSAALNLMFGGRRVAVVMPARDEAEHIAAAIDSIPEWVDAVVVIDDGSNDGTGEVARARDGPGCPLLVLRTNGIGVGAAISTGYRMLHDLVDAGLLPNGDWAAVVMAGDGQMDSRDIPELLAGLELVPFVKGNRFSHPEGLGRMPLRRRVGSRILSRLTGLATGQKVHDPQCGYTAVRLSVVRHWEWVHQWSGYGYPNWWLLKLAERSIPFKEVPVRSVYRNEKSGIRVRRFLPKISVLLFAGLWRRGIGWYLLRRRDGQGNKASLATSSAISCSWFGSWIALAGIPLVATASIFAALAAVAVAITGFSIARFLDMTEVQRRLNPN